MTSSQPRRLVASMPALGGSLGAFALDAIYLAAIAQQSGTPPGARVPFVAAWIAAAALLAGIGAVTDAAPRRALLLSVAAAAMVALAVPGLWSIGVPLFICAIAVGLGAATAADGLPLPRWVLLAAPLALIAAAGVILFAGFALTEG